MPHHLLPTGGLTRTDAVERLRSDGLDDAAVDELDGLLAACEAARYAGMTASGGDVIERARNCLRRLERTWKP